MAELTPEQQQQVEELLEQVVAVEDSARATLLDSADVAQAVRDEVKSLLSYHPAACDKLDTAVVAPDAVVHAVNRVLTGSTSHGNGDPKTVGPYAILRRLGEGGMGTVYLAEQAAPLKRQVAIKLIKLGLDTRSVLARFDAERQALALMNHTNVAHVLDAGSTEDGRPYFVMEYVEGVCITEYCDEKQLDIPARLLLFGRVCDAVQHAHQKGVIHRDIKPSNVIVSSAEGAAVPKVIDFGVAKATNQHLAEQSIITEHGVLIGTPEYMSPEQARLDQSDVDTRSDIYSLGVLLYELLVGALPIDGKTLRRAGIEEVQRLIREHDPPKPTTRLASLKDGGTLSANQRGTVPASLIKKVRGDLEWIVMKCLEKDRDRRYATTTELSDDLDRFAHNQPVLAGPPTLSYRVKKFARRNRGFVAGAALVFLVFTVGTISTITFAIGESRQRAVAQAEADTNSAINKFLNEMLASVDPKKAKGRDVGVMREILAEAVSRVGTEFVEKPQVEASVRRTIGRTYLNLGLYKEAAPHLERAYQLEQSSPVRSAADLATAAHLLGSLRDYQGQFDEGERLLRNAINLRRGASPSSSALVGSLIKLAEVLLNRRQLEEAKACIDEARSIQEQVYGSDSVKMAPVLNLLASYYSYSGMHEQAEPLLRACLKLHGESLDDVDTLVTLYNLGLTLKELGNYDEAETYYRRARDGYARVLSSEHPAYLAVNNALAGLMELQGRHGESEALQREVLAALRRTLGEKHPRIHSSLNNLGTVLFAQGKSKEALTIFRESVEFAREVHGEGHPVLAVSLAQLGFTLRDTKDASQYAEAEASIQGALSIFGSTLPKNHPYTLNTLRGLRRLYDTDAMNDVAKLAEVQARLDESDPKTTATDP